MHNHFHISIETKPLQEKLNPGDFIYFEGSCFAENIFEKAIYGKIPSACNPYGTIYNPFSLFLNAKNTLLNELNFELIAQNQGIFSHWHAASDCNALNAEECKQKFENAANQQREYLSKAKLLVISLGTSFIYEIKPSTIVANCHKFSSANFKKRKLSIEEIANSFIQFYEQLVKTNPTIQIILTISPVRHYKDGWFENQVSKGILFQAIDHIIHHFKLQNVHYFPAFEIMNDELRDYRFYAQDKIHPNQEAIDYIWSKWITDIASQSLLIQIKEVMSLHAMMQHKIRLKGGVAFGKFLNQFENKINEIEEKYAFLNLQNEKNYLKQLQHA